MQQKNLVLEGLTDLWYLESMTQLLRAEAKADLSEKIALVPAQGAGKVVYYATILHANKLKVAALLDSDVAGENAAKQDVLVHRLGNKGVLRTKDAYGGPVSKPEIEDLLRETLIKVAKAALSWDVSAQAVAQPNRPIIDIFTEYVPSFSKYTLAKTFVKWTRDNTATSLEPNEISQWQNLVALINKALK